MKNHKFGQTYTKTQNDSVKVLGIKINENPLKLEAHNMDPFLAKIKDILQNWGKKQIVLLCRIYAIKSVGIAQVLHVMAALPTLNKEYLTEINKTIYGKMGPLA